MDYHYRPRPRSLRHHRSQLLVLGGTLFPAQRMVSNAPNLLIFPHLGIAA